MLQRVSNALHRSLQNARFSGPPISTRALGIFLTHGVDRVYSLNTVSTPQKKRGLGSIQLLRPMSSSAVQRDVPRRGSRTVSNLDPKRLNMSDIVDLNGPVQPSVRFGASGLQLDYHWPNTPFPPNSKGFLYYYCRPGLPAGTGEIRFRVVGSRSASYSSGDRFANGRDLLDHTGHRPWRIHMLQLYTTRDYDPIRRLLLSNGLIDAARDRETEQRVSVSNVKSAGGSTILDTISDTFVIQLPALHLRFAFIHDECIVLPASSVAHKVHWRDRIETVEGSNARWRVYQGAAVVRFELKKAEKNNTFYRLKEGEVVLVLRILELLDPMDPDGVPYRLLEGGELVQGTSPNWSWCTSLDRAQRLGIITPSSLKILEELYLGKNASGGTTVTKCPSS